MAENKFSTVYGVRLYPMDYLINEELTESDINNIFDTNSFLYSVIIGMFREINSPLKNFKIIKMCKTDPNWYTKFTWSKKQFENYEQKIYKAIKNIYQYGDEVSKSKAQWYMIQYAFTVK